MISIEFQEAILLVFGQPIKEFLALALVASVVLAGLSLLGRVAQILLRQRSK